MDVRVVWSVRRFRLPGGRPPSTSRHRDRARPHSALWLLVRACALLADLFQGKLKYNIIHIHLLFKRTFPSMTEDAYFNTFRAEQSVWWRFSYHPPKLKHNC